MLPRALYELMELGYSLVAYRKLVAADWANAMAVRLNEQMRERAIAESTENVGYLKAEIAANSLVALQQPQHVRLSLRFHLSRRTGEVTKVVERGTKSINSMIYFLMFNILPTIIELVVVGNAVLKDNPEAVRAAELGLSRTSMSGALREIGRAHV